MELSKKQTAQSWRRAALPAAILMSLSAISTTVNADRAPIGDLEIYKSLKPGKPKLMIMIDVSTSMGRGSIAEDYGNCSEGGTNGGYGQFNDIKQKYKFELGDSDYEYIPYGCQVGQNKQGQNYNQKEFDRISRLQITLLRLLSDKVTIGNDDTSNLSLLSDDYGVGIGIFGYEATGEKAKILAPVGDLNDAKRKELIEVVKNLRSQSTVLTARDNANNANDLAAIPVQPDPSIASALAEAGAYMLNSSPLSITPNTFNDTFSGFNESVPSSKSNDKYSELNLDQCSGKGIFVLTGSNTKRAGSIAAENVPSDNSTSAISTLPNIQMMNKSFGLTATSTTLFNQCTVEFSGSWQCTGAYAKALRDPSFLTRGAGVSSDSIKTATAGIGDAFSPLASNKKEITVNGKKQTIPDCSKSDTPSIKNLCKLGELKENATEAYGNGKFYPITPLTEGEDYAATTISESIADFASGLTGIGSATPAGTITVPNNPYQVAEQLPFAYLPMLQPNISATSSVWNGNLKKYNLNNGTLYGKSNSALYTNTAGTLSTSTKDLWQADTTVSDTDSSAIDVGGVYAKLTTPQSGLSSARTVYVEDVTSAESSTPILRKVGVNEQGNLTGFDVLVDPIYTEQNKRRILSFLGFKQYKANRASTEIKELLDVNGNTPSNFTALDGSTVMLQPTEAVRVLGGVVHSKPAAISYSANLDANGKITSTREDYALFGSMDGALHLVNAANDSGVEQYAIIPKKMVATQSIALVKDSKKDAVGQPFFGVDAPWLVTTDYTYDLATGEGVQSKVKVDSSTGNGMFAYGGLRMGGEGLYGINITDKDAPSMLFTITPSTTGFSRLGQTWSKPTAAKIRTSKNAAPIDVLVFGGGYDMQYESDTYKPEEADDTTGANAEPAKGNAIYIVNANTGALIWSTSSDATNTATDASYTQAANMIHSITGGITVLDRDNDGLMDHIYAADLGGQVFRADFQNARPAKFGFEEVNSFSNKRVVRILNTTGTGTAINPTPYRFYERPVVSFYRNETTSKLFALVNVISGNRSAPLSKIRDDNNTYANRVYGIIDTDVTSTTLYNDDFYTDRTDSIKDLEESKLLNLKTQINAAATTSDSALTTNKTSARNALVDGSKNGWYYPLTRFDGYENVKYNKGIGESIVINNLLYTTVYNPDKMYSAPQSCVTSILGGSERQVYCLPYGICTDTNSKNGTGGYVPAGQGIQELTLGAFNNSNTDVKVLIGTRTLTDRIKTENRIDYNSGDSAGKYYDPSTLQLEAFSKLGDTTGGDGSAVEYLFNERYTLQPKTWYEKQ